MVKLTAKQLAELFGVDRGTRLYEAINSFYGLELNLAELSEGSVKKMLAPDQFWGPKNINILSSRRAGEAISFFKRCRIEIKLETSIHCHHGGDNNKVFDRAFDIVYKMLEVGFPSGGLFGQIAVGESNLWELARTSFKNSLYHTFRHVCYFDFDDKREWYVKESNERAWAVTNCFLAGGFYIGYYPKPSFRDTPDTVLVLVK